METTKHTAFLANDKQVSDAVDRIRMYVIFASDLNEQEQWINRRLVDFCDAMDLSNTLILLGKEYGGNVLLEPVKESEVSDTEWEQLRALQFAESEVEVSEDNWDEYICLPEGACTACGGTGYLTMDCCADGQRYELRGDCDECDASGQS
jgi:hypothetical protein